MKEKIMEAKDAIGQLKPAPCWGTYDETYKECTVQCQIRKWCKQSTKNKNSKVPPALPAGKDEEPSLPPPMPDPDPLEYLVTIMSGNHEVETKMTETVKGYVFKKDGKPVFQVAVIRATGKAKLIALTEPVHFVVVDKLESVSHVEGLLAELQNAV